MNAQSIWAGEEYAFSNFRPNSKFVMNARKCRAKRVTKVEGYGRQRASAYVIADVLDEETNTIVELDARIRARDVIDFWDSYARERDAFRKEREQQERIRLEQQERMMREREERLTLEREQREAQERAAEEKRQALVNALTSKSGMPAEAIEQVGAYSITLRRHVVELWLSNGEQ